MRFVTLALAGAIFLASAATAAAQTPIINDPFSSPVVGQHKTAVEPDTFAFGSTIVASAQIGRIFDGGAAGIGWATSTNNGATWVEGTLPALTKAAGGPWDRATDPSVAYDRRHNVWLISTLVLTNTASGPSGRAVLTSRSTDGGLTWGSPVNTAVAASNQDFDKNWITCDNTTTSPYYGSCYTQFDDHANGNALKMSYSRDGGATWAASSVPRVGVIGGQPLVLPNGNVVVPLDNAYETALGYTVSTNGGVKFGTAFSITSISAADDPGNIRSGPLPSAEIAGGKIWVVWEDCRFRTNCSSNDIVYTTSTNGTTWSAVKRIPIDPVTSTVDHLIPGVAVAGSTGNIASVTYYYFPVTNCGTSCSLYVGHVSTTNGGTSWSTPTQVAGPMSMSWIPDTTQGRMVGDYISSSFGSDGNAHPAFAVASAPSSGVFAQPVFTASLAATGGGVAQSSDAVVFEGSAAHASAPFSRH
ncbi:MAG TPA: sialidase family protein [Solirubrobacteraceae bacterium]|jgi:hypothetical protein|nr:sialidase family protein [Solirubrobacteraceae bacterium]